MDKRTLDRLKRALVKLREEDPKALHDLLRNFRQKSKAGRKDRPGGWALWCMVRAVMTVRGIKQPRTACKELVARGPQDPAVRKVFKDSPMRPDVKHLRVMRGKPNTFKDEWSEWNESLKNMVKRGGARSAEALTKEYYRLEAKRRDDTAFRAECDDWLPTFIEAERRSVSPFDVLMGR